MRMFALMRNEIWRIMLLMLIILAGCAGAGLVLFGIYQASEKKAAAPVEPPTPADMHEGNLSAKIPVADE